MPFSFFMFGTGIEITAPPKSKPHLIKPALEGARKSNKNTLENFPWEPSINEDGLYCPFGQNEIIKDLAEVSSMKNYARFFLALLRKHTNRACWRRPGGISLPNPHPS